MRRSGTQVRSLVVTGASSGIGLATALLAARKGHQVLLVSRNGPDLKRIVNEIAKTGGAARYVVGDVSRREDLESAAEAAVQAFGRIDAWVNNAGVTLFGALMETPLEEERRLFEVNFWGTVYGSLIALRHMKEKGGAIVNLGSVLSNRAIPLQGAYSASKHAVKSFTDALRMELEREGVPVTLSLIKPASVNTPFPIHARSHLSGRATLVPPYYDPDLVARAILHCTEHPHRDVNVGAPAFLMGASEKFFPRLIDRIFRAGMFRAQERPVKPRPASDGLYEPPPSEGRIRGDYEGPVLQNSLLTAMRLHPARTLLFSLGALAGTAAALRWKQSLRS